VVRFFFFITVVISCNARISLCVSYCLCESSPRDSLSSMGGRAKSLTKKAQIQSEEKESLIQLAVAVYRVELKKPKDERQGARTVCKKISDEHQRKTGREVRVDHNTMLHRLNGRKSHTESHAEKSWLSSEEAFKLSKNTSISFFVPGWEEYSLALGKTGSPVSSRSIATA